MYCLSIHAPDKRPSQECVISSRSFSFSLHNIKYTHTHTHIYIYVPIYLYISTHTRTHTHPNKVKDHPPKEPCIFLSDLSFSERNMFRESYQFWGFLLVTPLLVCFLRISPRVWGSLLRWLPLVWSRPPSPIVTRKRTRPRHPAGIEWSDMGGPINGRT